MERPASRANRGLYPPVEPHLTGYLPERQGHRVYYEVCGNPLGKPAVFVHGGPGGGCEPKHRQFWDPEAYRVVLFDQRGCGRSQPYAKLEANTTWHLVADMERLREQLEIERWQVFGGSWGSTLGLAYAQTHPERVSEMVLRGIFLCREKELRWFYQDGTSRLFPEAWERFLAPIPEDERHDIFAAYHRRLNHEDEAVRHEAARAWSVWEGSTSRLLVDPDMVRRTADPQFAEAFARIECHYFVNLGFMDEGKLLGDMDRLEGIPATIVQGRYDAICPPGSAWELHRAWPGSELIIVPDAGHSAFEPGTAAALVAATDSYRGA